MQFNKCETKKIGMAAREEKGSDGLAVGDTTVLHVLPEDEKNFIVGDYFKVTAKHSGVEIDEETDTGELTVLHLEKVEMTTRPETTASTYNLNMFSSNRNPWSSDGDQKVIKHIVID